MALIIPPAAGATSLCSVAAADAYHLARGNAAWALLDNTAKEAALIRATDYLGGTYGQRWKGYRVSAEQTLDWPRYDVAVNGYLVDSSVVPAAVANACAELALRAATGPLTIDVGRLKSRVKVGPIETEYVAGSGAQTRYTAVENLLAGYLSGGTSMIAVVRA
ncbi:DnaT-like ssDNA-binding protein [Variovorax sp. UMC13]|uniref:DnaT-like ssDNA-binding protein n=1 Tax=Variovorax sp. UMC13 TaxID=1862326 RepID=UPI001604194C|nr:DnaT-like ssDNA-binding protein [Variovorax sp. UMC13]MBB1599483.1 hypothetical protein [Variovorax sp. UMC13]